MDSVLPNEQLPFKAKVEIFLKIGCGTSSTRTLRVVLRSLPVLKAGTEMQLRATGSQGKCSRRTGQSAWESTHHETWGSMNMFASYRDGRFQF